MAQIIPQQVLLSLSEFLDKLYASDDFPPKLLNAGIQMRLYTVIYDFLTSNSRDDPGKVIYNLLAVRVKEKVVTKYETIKSMTEEDSLRNYRVFYNHFKKQCSVLAAPCAFIDRHWISRERGAGRSILEIKELAEQIYERNFFQPLFPYIQQTCLNLIKSCRINRTSVPIQTIRNILQLYNDEDFLNIIHTDAHPHMYEEYFENDFLRDAREYYSEQQIPPFESDQILDYLTSIALYFEYEINFIQPCLLENNSTWKKLLEIMESIFFPEKIFIVILDKIKLLVSNENNYQELLQFYQVICKIPKIKNQLVQAVENHITDMAINAIHDQNPKEYMETILGIYKKYLDLVHKDFNSDQDLTTAFHKACSRFINENSVTKTAGNRSKSSDLLARYCDGLLRKDNGVDIEEKFNEIMIVFDYIEDKDIFEKFYRKYLAKRLINQLSLSDDYEKLMFLKLKEACGSEYTSKLQRMFQDIDVSRTLMNDYENHQLGFSVMVLSANSWPFSTPGNILLPNELKFTFDNFTNFYAHRHDGRKLTGLHQYSHGELQTFFTSQKYTLQVSTYQMIVLLLFNKELIWTVERIQDETQIKFELLLPLLLNLLESKLLIRTDINEDQLNSDIKMNSSIRLATQFQSKKLRVNLNTPIKSVEQKDIENVYQRIDEDRKMVIQAVIVRIMKGHQTCKLVLLIQEVIQQLNSHFKPEIVDIKKAIELLILNEYLQRDPDDKNILHYIN